MQHQNGKAPPAAAVISAPPGAVWYGLESIDETEGNLWRRCENPDWGKSARWWRVEDETPVAVAQRFGDATYRVVWTPKDRRQLLGFSEPFRVTPIVQPGPVAPTDDEDDFDDDDDQDDEEHIEQPPVMPAYAGFPKPPPKQADVPVVGPQFQDPALHSVVTLFQLLRGDTLLFHQQLMHQQQLAMESERQRSRETIAAYQAQLTIMETVRVQSQRQQRDAGHVQLAGALQEIAMRVDQMQADTQGELPLSENPTDMERILRGANAIVTAIANSPFGEHIAKALANKLGAATGVPAMAPGQP